MKIFKKRCKLFFTIVIKILKFYLICFFLGKPQAAVGYRKYSAKYDPNQEYVQPDLLMDGRYVDDDDYNAKLVVNDRTNAAFDEFEREPDLSSNINNYRAKLAFMKNQNEQNLNPRFFNKFKDDKYIDIVPSKDVLAYNRLGNSVPDSNLNLLTDDYGRSAKWSLCKKMKDRYSSNQPMNFAQMIPSFNQENVEGMPFRDKYSRMDGGRKNREINNLYPEKLWCNEPGGKSSQISENEYYDADLNPLGPQENMNTDEDYGPILREHAFIRKRDGMRQQERMPVEGNLKKSAEATKALLDALSLTGSKGDGASVGQMLRNQIENNGNVDISSPSKADLLWKINPNLQSSSLQDVVRNSQKAIKQVQYYQQKHSAPSLKSSEANENGFQRKSRNLPLIKWENKNMRIDETRLKREDEDEQKNMKTGTDEGGGGEYEDEEGKGHKDEEEYYEDADLSEDESANDIKTTDNLNQKYVKREIAEGLNTTICKSVEDNSCRNWNVLT